jgi:sugar transferase (PEP-CTERM/EpsH1 system associated)
MKILFIVPYVPSLVRVRPYNLIRHLSTLGHEVRVLTVWTNEREREEAEQLRHYCHDVRAIYLARWRSLANCLRALPTRTPLQSVYSWHPALVQGILDQNWHADVIHVEHLRGAHYGLALRSRSANGRRPVPIVWDSVDCITHLFRQAADHSSTRFGRWLTYFELTRTARHEGWLANQFSRVLVTSQADRTALLSLLPTQQPTPHIKVLPNGVDVTYFKPQVAAVREPATLVLSGKMSYHANATMVMYFVNSILPYVWARRPEVSLCVVGKDPPREVQALAGDRRVSVVGTVPDIRPYLQHATVAIAPLTYGAGIQNKVLEAMACATPVVASPQAVSALAVKPEEDLLVARRPADFAEAVVGLLDDPELRLRIGRAGRCYVERKHRWEDIAAQLEGVYDEVVCTSQ